jgi:hypothetical protein
MLHRQGEQPTKKGRIYRARVCDCRQCPLKKRCVPKSGEVRKVLIMDRYEALLRVRRARDRGRDEDWKELYPRHQWWAEGRDGEAKIQHGLARGVRRGRWNVAIQSYLTAAVINLKRLAKTLAGNPRLRPAVTTLTRLIGGFCRLPGLDPATACAVAA